MAGNSDPQRRPVLYDLKNQRFLADPLIGSKYYPISSDNLNADATIDLINTATSSVIAAARVVAASTSAAGVVQLSDSVSSSSAGTAATSLAVKTAYDLAAAALEPGDIGVTVQGYDASTLKAANIGATVQGYDADTAKTDVAQTFTAAQRGAYVTLTDAATVAVDMSLGNQFQVTLGGNRTLGAPTNVVAGQSGVIRVVQDGSGSRTLAYNSVFKFPGGTAPTLTTAANAVDLLAYHVESTTRIAARFIGDVK